MAGHRASLKDKRQVTSEIGTLSLLEQSLHGQLLHPPAFTPFPHLFFNVLLPLGIQAGQRLTWTLSVGKFPSFIPEKVSHSTTEGTNPASARANT